MRKVTAVLGQAWHALQPGGLVVIRSIIADREQCQNEIATLLAAGRDHDYLRTVLSA